MQLDLCSTFQMQFKVLYTLAKECTGTLEKISNNSRNKIHKMKENQIQILCDQNHLKWRFFSPVCSTAALYTLGFLMSLIISSPSASSASSTIQTSGSQLVWPTIPLNDEPRPKSRNISNFLNRYQRQRDSRIEDHRIPTQQNKFIGEPKWQKQK